MVWCNREQSHLLLIVVIYPFLLPPFVIGETSLPLHSLENLSPYEPGKHGSPRSHRYVRDCQLQKYGNVTHQTQASHGLQSPDIILPITAVNRFIDKFQQQWTEITNFGHIAFVNNPAKTISVLEPGFVGGCNINARFTVSETAKQKDCLIAVNAGMFNTHSGECLGNIVSDGRMVKNTHGTQNANFGIRKDGTVVFGYLSEEEVLESENPFVQLVGGVGWLIRDGVSYIEESKKAECEDTEETGSIETFFNIQSARTAIGSDKSGRVVLATIDGSTGQRGVSLEQFADWLLKHDVVNAINLDGGGSATFVVNGSVVNYPYDECTDRSYHCARQVSTVICVHEPECTPNNCSGHGECVMGICRCHGNWIGSDCSQLQCGFHNCSSNGKCTENGCVCTAGFQKPDCADMCIEGSYGANCQLSCRCENGGRCDAVTGECSCMSGYTGQFCQRVCPYGFHGPGCHEQCDCIEKSCPCHHITGLCVLPTNDSWYSPLMKAGQCLANNLIKRDRLVPYVPMAENLYFIGCLFLGAVAAMSILCNIFLLGYRCSFRCSTRPLIVRSSNKVYHAVQGSPSSTELES